MKPGIRVAHFMPSHPSLNGVSVFCRGLSKAMNRIERGSCPIITFRKGAADFQEEDEELICYSGVSKNPFKVSEQLKADLESNKHGVDGVVLHGTYNPPMAGLGKVLRKLKIPYIFIPHDPYPSAMTKHHRFRKTVYWHLFEKKLINGARALQILDESHKKLILETGCRIPLFVLPNGCEPETLNDLVLPIRTPGGEETIKVQYLGRMDRNHKGLDLLIEAFAGLRKTIEGENAQLVLSGNDWTDRKELELLANNLGISDHVKFTGRRPEPSIQLHAESDVSVLTSRFDGFGLTMVEAMLAARPVVVSSEAGIASHVKKSQGGWVVAPNVKSIEEGLKEAIRQKHAWPQMGKNNKDYVLENLRWETVARKTLENYQRIFG